jgi:hypothetical protein
MTGKTRVIICGVLSVAALFIESPLPADSGEAHRPGRSRSIPMTYRTITIGSNSP